MYYEKALRLLANLERVNEDTTDDLLGEKFGYIVSCQVYGNMKKNQDSKTDNFDQLMHIYPHFCGIYTDNTYMTQTILVGKFKDKATGRGLSSYFKLLLW